jgi:alkanesulfonate monooxygenase SsuD/methylene tetrahydromethanopterin reductase-like flavin-dependent oxidoreductase (luciferase family)
MVDRALPPERLPELAAGAERLGADEIWLVEDLGWTGAIATVATALAATSRVHVGIGIIPAPLRSPAVLAMELATLERLHPGRLIAGIGHGVPEWMARIGVRTPSPLALLEETFGAVRTLLAGAELDVDGRAVSIHGLQLVHPPTRVPPLIAGVKGPKSLELAGRIADGTVLAEGSGPAHVVEAHAAAARGGGTSAHEVSVFVHLAVDADADAARARVAPAAADAAGFLGIPVDQAMVAAGTPADAAAVVTALWDAGAASVIVRPVSDDPLEQFAALVAELRTAASSTG